MNVTHFELRQLASVVPSDRRASPIATCSEPERRAVIGGGAITTPAVAAHVRKRIANGHPHAEQTSEA